jgi:membrane protease YdiL (CAAX protease family)
MVGCGLAVAAVAAPVAVVGWRVARRSGEPILPRWRPWRVPWARVPWGGFEVVVAFLVLTFVIPGLAFQALVGSDFFTRIYGPEFPPAPTRAGPSVEASAAVAGAVAAEAARARQAELATLRELWVAAVALPFQVGLLVLVRRALYPGWTGRARRPSIATRLTLAVLAWAALTPAVLVFNQVVLALLSGLGGSADVHPLARLTGLRPVPDQILFLLRACVAAPLVEEILFRGALLPWLLGGRYRAWAALAVGVMVAAIPVLLSGPPGVLATRGPVLFAVALVVGYGVLIRVCRRRARTVGAVYASAAVFAAVHSPVWPSPVPLFALGLGLGYLAVRTRGVFVPAVVHGMFNAVSALFVLMS